MKTDGIFWAFTVNKKVNKYGDHAVQLLHWGIVIEMMVEPLQQRSLTGVAAATVATTTAATFASCIHPIWRDFGLTRDLHTVFKWQSEKNIRSKNSDSSKELHYSWT